VAETDFKTILVLDDDPQFHKLVVPVLTYRGHKVVSAHRADEASELMKSNKVDLAIVDGQLPDKTGIDWITEVRSRGVTALIMFVSAYWRDAQSYHKLTKELGVSLVLHKPVMASVFAAEVDILLGRAADDSSQRDFEDTLLALRSEYAQELPGRLGELSGLIKQITTLPDNLFLLGEARTHAHKLRGTASSYGFQPIGDLSGDIEEAIIKLIRGDGDRAQLVEEIDAAIHKAIAIAASAAKEVEEKVSRRTSSVPDSADFELQEAAPVARILAVDDDAAFLDLVDELARRHQMEAVRASNAFEALELSCMTKVDAALIDVELGSRDIAFKLAADLRLLPGYHQLPLGFLSGSGHIEKTIEVDNVGHCLLFDRPQGADALEAALRQLMAIKQASRPRILLIDDDVDFLKRTAFVLSHEGMEVQTLTATADILERMQQFSPDLVLLDVMMPGVSGFDICRMLRTIPRWRDLPIVFLTAYADIDTRLACLKCGGDDYLIKPVVNEELLVRLRMRLDRARSLKQRLEHDHISGLLARPAFMEQFAGMFAEAKRHNWSLVVCLMKIIGLGSCSHHVVSDSVLSTAGNLILKRLRTEDLKGRFNDETLILAFRAETQTSVEPILTKLVNEFDASPALDHEECAARPNLTYGLACYPDDGGSMHELLEIADRRLHQGSLDSARKPVH
jgi:diguanylate cyclase (GGDEF)-like protein